MTRFLCAVCFVVTLLACSNPASERTVTLDPSFVWANPPGCDSAAPAVGLSAARRDSLPFYALNDGNTVIARTVPGGWGGFYVTPVNGQNRSVVLLVDTTNLSAALDTLKRWYPHYSFARDSVVVRMVRWDWILLAEWYGYFAHVGLPDVNFGDINEVTNRLEFGSGSAQGRQAAILQRLNDLHAPCWLAAVNEQGARCSSSVHRRRPSPGSQPGEQRRRSKRRNHEISGAPLQSVCGGSRDNPCGLRRSYGE